MSLLDVRDLTVRRGDRTVVRDVRLTLAAGEGLALVGGSGAGKSSIALALMGLLPRGAVTGTVHAAGRLALAFQDAGAGLNPVRRVGWQVAETAGTPAARAALVDAGFPDPDLVWNRYPHQLSGGQRQRVMLAVALALQPAVLIADEPTTGLDPTLSASLLARLAALRRERALGVLLITHDLGAARRAVDRAAVLAAGSLVETASIETLFTSPASDAGRALVAAAPALPEFA